MEPQISLKINFIILKLCVKKLILLLMVEIYIIIGLERNLWHWYQKERMSLEVSVSWVYSKSIQQFQY